ncbi:transporter substrate-binding domain-containing protein [bacterium]|nr:transporter substrate-binding domain-containing protein [bacterium]
MKRKKTLLLLILLLMISSFKLYAKELKLAVGLALPPYFIQENDSGLELDIIRAALKSKGYTVQPVFLPFARIIKAMDEGKVDCASPINENSGVKAHYSDTHIFYQNFAVSLKSNNLRVNTIDDLMNKKIVSFQNAKKYLGNEFATMASNNPDYLEKANQETQNLLLFKNRTQIVVGDINIFKYYTRKVANRVDTTQEVVYHSLFPKTYYKVAFRDESVKNDFNEGLKQIRASDLYQKIIAQYTK